MMYKFMIKLLVSVGCALAFSNAQAICFGTASDFDCNQQNYAESLRNLNTPPAVDNSNTEGSYYTPSYSPPPKASQYGAVAWDLKRSVWGYSVMQPTQNAANLAAIADCGLNSCKITSEFANTCAAISSGSKRKGGFTSTQTGLMQLTAEQKAMASCKANATNCEIILSECSLP